jgi:hypothetical protein
MMELFDARVARFIIDVHQSGQYTLNWLTLSLLAFGYRVWPITHIYHNCERNRDYPGKNFIELHAEVSLKNPRQMPISVGQNVTPSNAFAVVEDEKPAPRWPGYCHPHPLVRSDAFPVLVTPKDHWDDLEVRVFFNSALSSDDQRLFERLINSWLQIGSFGGWGGTGIDSGRPTEFDATAACAVFGADMGDSVDRATALTVLIRVLEGLNDSVPIDAVLFGKLDRRSQ